jgi:ATP-dependent RNA helicase RhlE
VAHALYPVPQHLKASLLMALLNQLDRDSVLIFTRTKHRAKRLADQLAQAGHATACLQGNLSQRQRKSALDGFRSGRHQILVATDLAARGLDVSSISHVVNFDMPGSVDDYIHRIGRTGRAAKTGDAFTLVTREDESSVRPIERILGAPIERRQLAGFNYADKPPHGARSGSHPPRHDGRRPAEHGSREQAASSHRPAGGPHSHAQHRPHSHSPHRSSNAQSSSGSGHRAAHPAHHHSNERSQHRP